MGAAIGGVMGLILGSVGKTMQGHAEPFSTPKTPKMPQVRTEMAAQ
jgi:hypothetical protein